MQTAIRLAERGLLPLPLLRFGVRRLCTQRLRDETARPGSSTEDWIEEIGRSDVAEVPEKANEQHYEVPPGFFEIALGPRLKYSSGFFPGGDETLAEGEERMLEITCERADLADGQRILELGCGWGSLTLWMAEHYPNAEIVAVSNSAPQRRFILARAAAKGLGNLTVLTADMNGFDAVEATGARFDRVVSVEMFEHMRNWPELLGRVRGWIEDDGKLFLHVFSHKRLNYPFRVRGATDWMSEYFFSGGMMPSDDLLPRMAAKGTVPFEVEDHQAVSGRHYARTAQLWRENIEAKKSAVMPVLEGAYGDNAGEWFQRWRLFFLACEELFGYRGGAEWGVSHYRLRPAHVSDPTAAGDTSAETARSREPAGVATTT
ncbi:MAG: cyclopropane-fatty-acyl-phospholipid synthase family protein [Planctomycetota bacterium]